MITREGYPRRREGILKQRVSGTLLLFNLEEGQYYALDDVGGRIWDLCDGTQSVSELVSRLCQEYEAPAETIEADVLELLGDLESEKLVVEGT